MIGNDLLGKSEYDVEIAKWIDGSTEDEGTNKMILRPIDSIPICDYCSLTLVELMDSSGKNLSYFCNRCQITREPGETRRKSKLGIQKQEVEPAVSSVGGVPDVSIRKEIQLKDGALALSKRRTIRFTSYSDSSQN